MDDLKWFEDSIDCPYCQHRHRPEGTDEEDGGEAECQNPECGKEFYVLVELTPTYTTTKVDQQD